MIISIMIMIILWIIFIIGIFYAAWDCNKGDDNQSLLMVLIISVVAATVITYTIFFTEVSKDTYSRLSEEVELGEHGKRIQHYAKDGKITILEESALFFNDIWDRYWDNQEQDEKELNMEKKKLLDKLKQTQ